MEKNGNIEKSNCCCLKLAAFKLRTTMDNLPLVTDFHRGFTRITSSQRISTSQLLKRIFHLPRIAASMSSNFFYATFFLRSTFVVTVFFFCSQAHSNTSTFPTNRFFSINSPVKYFIALVIIDREKKDRHIQSRERLRTKSSFNIGHD